jgi:hypothetical protein
MYDKNVTKIVCEDGRRIKLAQGLIQWYQSV